jgi:F-type H+-transporting ATPase subunit gamma
MGANLKEVRERIKSVLSTQQITKAMKMVSAAKLRRAQQAITQMRPYADRLNKMLVNIMSNLDGGGSSAYSLAREVDSVLLVVVTSNRGLCGAFNTNVLKAASQEIADHYEAQRKNKKLTILCIGKKGYDFFRRKYADCTIIKDHVELFGDLSFDNVSTVSKAVIQEYMNKRYDVVKVAYGRFKNAGMQFPEVVQFLPVAKIDTKGTELPKAKADYIFEPEKESLLEELIPSILQVSFQKFLLDTHASEHGARMTAMDKATENADEMLKELKINYNKARQEAITKELSEIVGGAAALNG